MRPLLTIGVVLLAALLAARALGQSPPPDLESLPPNEFVDAAKSYLRSAIPPSPQQVHELVELTWTRFLGEAEFIANGDWQTIADVASLVGVEIEWLSASTSDATSERVTALLARLDARLNTQPVPQLPLESLIAADGILEAGSFPRGGLAARAAEWMRTHSWQELSLRERIRLANLLHAERMPVERFSVRWTGTITAPADGQYVFEQLRQHHIDGVLRVSLSGNVILDSAAGAVPEGDGSDRVQVTSEAVTLAAGAPVPILVEYQYDAASMVRNHDFAERIFPMAVLQWKRGDGDAEIIPPSAFTTPAGAAGIEGEYFGDLEFNQSILTRIDPGLQMIWSSWQIASEHAEEQAAVTASCLETLQNEGLSALPDRAVFLEYDLPKLLQRLPALDRAAIAEQLAADSEALQVITCDCARQLLKHLFMLPKDVVTDYVAAWVEHRDVEVSRILPYPGWGSGTYSNHSYDDYGWIGHSLRGGNRPVAQLLLNESLEREDGTCNLLVAYCISQAEVADRRSQEVREVLERRLDDEQLTGDRRATWLLARAFYQEVDVGGMPRPQLGLPYLQEAALVAESPEMQFRILQEMVARYASLGQVDAVTPLLEQAAGRHPNHAEEIASWGAQAEALSARYRSAAAE